MDARKGRDEQPRRPSATPEVSLGIPHMDHSESRQMGSSRTLSHCCVSDRPKPVTAAAELDDGRCDLVPGGRSEDGRSAARRLRAGSRHSMRRVERARAVVDDVSVGRKTTANCSYAKGIYTFIMEARDLSRPHLLQSLAPHLTATAKRGRYIYLPRIH